MQKENWAQRNRHPNSKAGKNLSSRWKIVVMLLLAAIMSLAWDYKITIWWCGLYGYRCNRTEWWWWVDGWFLQEVLVNDCQEIKSQAYTTIRNNNTGEQFPTELPMSDGMHKQQHISSRIIFSQARAYGRQQWTDEAEFGRRWFQMAQGSIQLKWCKHVYKGDI